VDSRFGTALVQGSGASLQVSAAIGPPEVAAGFSLTSLLEPQSFSSRARARSMSDADFIAQVKESARGLFPYQTVEISNEALGRGIYGKLFRVTVDGEPYRLKVASFSMLESKRGDPRFRSELPDLTLECQGLQLNHPRMISLQGVITDTPRDGERRHIIGHVTRWERGEPLAKAIQMRVLTSGEVKAQFETLMESLVQNKFYLLDRRLSQFLVRTHSPEDGSELERPEIIVLGANCWASQVDCSDEKFLHSACKRFAESLRALR
jgi:hypothetical protein